MCMFTFVLLVRLSPSHTNPVTVLLLTICSTNALPVQVLYLLHNVYFLELVVIAQLIRCKTVICYLITLYLLTTCLVIILYYTVTSIIYFTKAKVRRPFHSTEYMYMAEMTKLSTLQQLR